MQNIMIDYFRKTNKEKMAKYVEQKKCGIVGISS